MSAQKPNAEAVEIAKISSSEVQQFVFKHENDDPEKIALGKPVFQLSPAVIARQVAGRRKAKSKLPFLYKTEGIVYPPGVNIEQCSSEVTAKLKSNFLEEALAGQSEITGADISGGLGIDSFFFSLLCKRLAYAEPDPSLFQIARHNLSLLGARNIEFYCEDALAFLVNIENPLSFIYADPSRRKKDKKVFLLSDCEPNIPASIESIFSKTDLLVIKTSPLLDLSQGARELKGVALIVVIAVKNECREVLFFCRKDFSGEPEIKSVHLPSGDGNVQLFSFHQSSEKDAAVNLSEPLRYIYEPNAAILKAGAFKLIGISQGLSKLHPHTHLYTSSALNADFPGRIFEIEELNPDVKKMEAYFPERKANVLTRNYPESPEQLKKKLKLKDGGEKFLLAFSSGRAKFNAVAIRVDSQR